MLKERLTGRGAESRDMRQHGLTIQAYNLPYIFSLELFLH